VALKPKRRGPEAPIRAYATEQAAALLRRLAFQANHSAKRRDADSVHDLRVSIRRLKQCLRTFRQFYPAGGRKRIRRELSALMRLASEVRDRDIALAFLAEARIPAGLPLVRTLSEGRHKAEASLTAALKGWSRRGLYKKWRAELGL
jgi:CHAD domain-containing protein